MGDREADALLARGDRAALERVAMEAECNSSTNQGSNWCRACEAKRMLREMDR